jgi:hypothetical protein
VSRRLLAAVVVALCAVTAAPASHAAPATGAATYEPPFALGPSGGDDRGISSAEPDGRLLVARAYPAPGPISCPGDGHFTTLQVVHKAKGSIRKVTAEFTDALVDPFVYLSVGVRDATGRWIGSTKVGGAQGSGEVVVPVRWDRSVRLPLQVQFGLELSTACPHADAGTLRFTKVTLAP